MMYGKELFRKTEIVHVDQEWNFVSCLQPVRRRLLPPENTKQKQMLLRLDLDLVQVMVHRWWFFSDRNEGKQEGGCVWFRERERGGVTVCL